MWKACAAVSSIIGFYHKHTDWNLQQTCNTIITGNLLDEQPQGQYNSVIQNDK